MAEPRRKQCQRCGLNRDTINGYRTSRSRVCNKCQKGARQASGKDARLRETYGITLEEYGLLWTSQDGKCAICGGRRKVFDVDHDHKLAAVLGEVRGSVRGLLCRRCNRRLLPAATDDVSVLNRAIRYLVEPPARTVLKGVYHESTRN